MSPAKIELGHDPKLREILRHELTNAYDDLYAKAYATVPVAHWGTFGSRLLISVTLELAIEALASGDYTELFAWAKGNMLLDEKYEGSKQTCYVLVGAIEAVCERVVPAFSPLIGEIRMRLQRFKDILKHSNLRKWERHDDFSHSPIDVAVDDIINLLDEKHYATGEHSRCVSFWCQLIAKKLGFSEEFTKKVTRGGLIHDIGKTVVPIEILAAPRKLSDDEWKIMASHVTVGHEMLLQIPVLHDFQSIVRNHHEHYLGGGYPDNLAGEDIPLSTRVVTVADCFNAMIGRRTYRVPMSPQSAIDELRRHRGKQFDPDVTDAMTEVAYETFGQGQWVLPLDWHWKPRRLTES